MKMPSEMKFYHFSDMPEQDSGQDGKKKKHLAAVASEIDD